MTVKERLETRGMVLVFSGVIGGGKGTLEFLLTSVHTFLPKVSLIKGSHSHSTNLFAFFTLFSPYPLLVSGPDLT